MAPARRSGLDWPVASGWAGVRILHMGPTGVAAAAMVLVVGSLWSQELGPVCCTTDCMPVITIEDQQPALLPDTVVIGCPLPGCYPLDVSSSDVLTVEILFEAKNLMVEVILDEMNLSGPVLLSPKGTPQLLDEGLKTSWFFDPALTDTVTVVSFQVSDSGLGEDSVTLTLEISQRIQEDLIAEKVFSYVVQKGEADSSEPTSGEEHEVLIENSDKDLAVALVATSKDGVYPPYQLYRGQESFSISCPDPPYPQDQTRVAVLSDQNGLFFSEFSSWPSDGDPPLEITLPEVQEVDLYLWVSAEELDATSHSSECRSSATPAKDLHQNVKKALCHTALANVLLDEAHMGIRFNPVCQKAISHSLVEAVKKSWCGTGSDNVQDMVVNQNLVNDYGLNVYYASIGKTGACCEDDPQRIFIGKDAYPTTLAHELGHSFGLQHPSEEIDCGAVSEPCFAAANLMQPDVPRRSCLTQGQTFRSVLGAESSLNHLGLRVDSDGRRLSSLDCNATGECPNLCVDIGHGGKAEVPSPPDSDALLSWFESESCLDHESLAPFVNNDEQFPRLLDFWATVLDEGPSISRLALVAQDLDRNYTRVKNHPKYSNSCPCERAEYVDLHLESFARLYQVRASLALGIQGGIEAWRILAEALSTADDSIPIDVKELSFEILESAYNESEYPNQVAKWLAVARRNDKTPDEIKTKINQLLGDD